MRLRLVFGTVAGLVRLFSPAFLAPLALALWDGEAATATHFAIAFILAWGAGTLGALRFAAEPVYRRSEALGVVTATWVALSLFGAVPFVAQGYSLVDSVFESVSGFTTTGASILTDFSAPPRAIFLWRAMSQWIGGLGVIALFVVVLPRLGIAGRQLLFAESSSAPSEAVSPKVRSAAKRMWLLYVVLTAIEVVLLRMFGMPLYDATLNSLATLSAGGFSPNGLSILGYGNPAAEWTIASFMFLAGVSFPLMWRGVTGRPLALLRDGEFLVYAGVSAVATFGLAAILGGGSFAEPSLRAAAFHVTNAASATGFASEDFDRWSDAAKIVLVVVTVLGGCAGSAGGGAKVVRYLLVFQFLRSELTRVLHPRAVVPVRYAGQGVPPEVMRAVFTLVLLFAATYFVVGAILVLLGMDLVSGFTASLACVNNYGPGFGTVGPMQNYAHLPATSKVVLGFAMLVGRLEIVTVLALLHPHVWKHLQTGSVESGAAWAPAVAPRPTTAPEERRVAQGSGRYEANP